MTVWEKEIPVVQAMIDDNMSVRQIADFYNVSAARLYQVMSKYNISTHREFKTSFMRGKSPEEYWLMKTLCNKTQDKDLRLELFNELTPVPDLCPVLGIALDFRSKAIGQRNDNSPSLDRIDSDRGYEPGNCAVISWKANRIKNNGTATDHKLIYEWIENQING